MNHILRYNSLYENKWTGKKILIYRENKDVVVTSMRKRVNFDEFKQDYRLVQDGLTYSEVIFWFRRQDQPIEKKTVTKAIYKVNENGFNVPIKYVKV